ncbi:hypothetical protein G6F43_014063 [Rhizopus delemar]|nr:hypothetical protein G6F43_014063 [Rhizopus delemar]
MKDNVNNFAVSREDFNPVRRDPVQQRENYLPLYVEWHIQFRKDILDEVWTGIPCPNGGADVAAAEGRQLTFKVTEEVRLTTRGAEGASLPLAAARKLKAGEE